MPLPTSTIAGFSEDQIATFKWGILHSHVSIEVEFFFPQWRNYYVKTHYELFFIIISEASCANFIMIQSINIHSFASHVLKMSENCTFLMQRKNGNILMLLVRLNNLNFYDCVFSFLNGGTVIIWNILSILILFFFNLKYSCSSFINMERAFPINICSPCHKFKFELLMLLLYAIRRIFLSPCLY